MKKLLILILLFSFNFAYSVPNEGEDEGSTETVKDPKPDRPVVFIVPTIVFIPMETLDGPGDKKDPPPPIPPIEEED